MLPPDNRHVLLDLLRPPPRARLAHAVATTFTLDLTAALVAPLAFASHRLDGKQDPVAVMEAVRSASDRVDIFCQAGHIRVPARHSDLMAFLEGALHEVRPPRPGRLFHPKLWLMLFEADDGDSLRLVVTTRNLTDDVSWDAAVRLDGQIDSRPHASNAPLVNLVRRLPKMARDPLAADRTDRIEVLAETLRYATWDSLHPAGEPTFHVYGIDGTRPTPDFSGYRHLIVSPFVNDDGLSIVAPESRASSVILMSRPEEMERLPPATVDRLSETRIVSPLAGLAAADNGHSDGAPFGDEDPGRPLDAGGSLLGGGLHAKLFVVERNRAAYVFIGSANATDAAFDGNVEILVEFKGGATKLGVDTFLDQRSGMGGLLEPYAVAGGAEPDPEADAQAQLENMLRRLSSLRWSLTVQGASEPYQLRARVHSGLEIPDDVRCQVALLTQPGRSREAQAGNDATFENVPLADVTPFLAVKLSRPLEGHGPLEADTVIRAKLVNDPAGRLDAVLTRQVDTPEKFLRFLLLLLGLESLRATQLTAGDSGGSWGLAGQVGTLEAILRALAEHPAAIGELDRLVSRLRRTSEGRRILPEGFDALWDEVLEARRQLPRVLVGRNHR